METTSDLLFYVNGGRVVESSPDPDTTLLQYLRLSLGLTGTKLGCAVGGCGACTVMVSWFERRSGVVRHAAVNACLARLCSLHGRAVTTVEGVGSTRRRLHPVQERIASSHGSQCGFCTPGMVMSMYALLRNASQGAKGHSCPTGDELEAALAGNLCRCTGYRPIVEAFRVFTREQKREKKLMDFEKIDKRTQNGTCAMGEDCCMYRLQDDNNGCEKEPTNGDFDMPYNPDAQEAIFPSELQLSANALDSESLVFKSRRTTWYRPTSLSEVLRLKELHSDARFITGNSDIGVEVKTKKAHNPVLIAVTHVPELQSCVPTTDGLVIGGSVTLSELEGILKQQISELPEEKTRFFVVIKDMLKLVGSQQIRNVASVGGHIVAASPVSDLNPLFQATGCVVIVMATATQRILRMDEKFFTGPKTVAITKTEILVSISIPFSTENDHVYGCKEARTKSDDLISVTSGMMVKFQDGTDLVESIALSFSGMALTTVMAVNTARKLEKVPWDDDLLSRGTRLLMEELQLKPDAPGGKIAYRMALVQGMFYKFYLSIRLMLELRFPLLYKTPTPKSHESAVNKSPRPPSKGVQFYEQVDDQQLKVDAVGRPYPHLSSKLHATGEAVYTDDMTPFGNELQLALVTSTKAHARIIDVDPKDALRMDGVVDFITYRDVPGENARGVMNKDEEIFRTETVTCEGQTIGAILADTRVNAMRAAKAVKIEYEELDAIFTIEQAIQAKSFIEMPERKIVKGSIDVGMAASDHVIEGTFSMGGQKHFYMETQTCIVVPKRENGELDIFSSTQNSTQVQQEVGNALNLSTNKIACHVKRIGGGFGGKETASHIVALPVAIAAFKHQRPVRCMLDRDEDMGIVGGRHPFMARYKVGFTSAGKILALVLELYSNGGCSTDLSVQVLEEAVLQSDGCYNIQNLLVIGRVCKTNITSSTAFRGFGTPQATMICENWMTHVAKELGVDPNVIRELNLYNEGDVTPHNNVLTSSSLRRCWEEVTHSSNFAQRQTRVNEFNRDSRWRKRGIAMTPVLKGIGYGMFLNQAGALVNIYTDGSVLISHGGIEMGQGLHTKIIQIASRVLEISMAEIFISESNSSIVPNASPTSASSGSDLNGQAVLNACQTLMERLEPYRKAQPSGHWKDWVREAYQDMISLSATGFYKCPEIIFIWNRNQTAQRYNYYTMGAACSEVEIDCLTGEHVLLRTDIVMDVGKSLNPAIDVGQIEGGFIQGYGLFVLEQLKYTPKGLLRSKGPATYQIPRMCDIPIEFNVSILKGESNPKAVYSSKAIGEPPLNLAASVFFALREAVEAARAEESLGCRFSFHSPATAEAIRLAIVNEAGYVHSV